MLLLFLMLLLPLNNLFEKYLHLVSDNLLQLLLPEKASSCCSPLIVVCFLIALNVIADIEWCLVKVRAAKLIEVTSPGLNFTDTRMVSNWYHWLLTVRVTYQLNLVPAKKFHWRLYSSEVYYELKLTYIKNPRCHSVCASIVCCMYHLYHRW